MRTKSDKITSNFRVKAVSTEFLSEYVISIEEKGTPECPFYLHLPRHHYQTWSSSPWTESVLFLLGLCVLPCLFHDPGDLLRKSNVLNWDSVVQTPACVHVCSELPLNPLRLFMDSCWSSMIFFSISISTSPSSTSHWISCSLTLGSSPPSASLNFCSASWALEWNRMVPWGGINYTNVYFFV